MMPDPTGKQLFGYVALVEYPTNDAREQVFARRLADVLTALVPMWIAQMHTWSDAAIKRASTDAVQLIIAHGDDLQFGGKRRGATLTALAKAFAILARADGGVTALGVHACLTPHAQCPTGATLIEGVTP